MQKSLQKLEARLKAVGASLDVSDWAFNCDAPSGYVWAATGCVTIGCTFKNSGGSWLPRAIEWANEDLAQGADKVTDTEAILGHRHDLDDDTWGTTEDAPDHLDVPKG